MKRSVRRTVLMWAAFALAGGLLAASVSVASAAPVSFSPTVIKSYGFENSGDTFPTDVPYPNNFETPTYAFWGITSHAAYSGSSSFWCAGSSKPAGTDYWAKYPTGTRGYAQVALPELVDYYSSSVDFEYVMPSLGTQDSADHPAFSLIWSTPDQVTQQIVDNVPLTGDWTSYSHSMSRGNLSFNVSRAPALFNLRFWDYIENPGDEANGQGPAVDDFRITAYKYGPVRSLAIGVDGSGYTQLTWAKPAKTPQTSTDDERTVAYRVWRSQAGTDTAIELSAGARVPGTVYTDVTAVPGIGYRYWVQAADTGTGPGYGELSAQVHWPNSFTLHYASGANGSLSGVTSQTAGWDSDATTVTATPLGGYHLAGWSDGATRTARQDTHVTFDVSATANFAINTYAVRYAAGTGGSISGTASQTVNYGAAATTVTATPATGYHFVSWSDGKFAGASRQDTNVVGDIGVTANFAINTYAVRYTAGAGGSISGTASQTVNYGAAATTVTATPATGYHFVSWSDGKFAGASRQDTNVVGDIGVTANFAINTYAVRYTAGAGGSISGTASQTVNYGAAATTVTATPATGYHFVSWSDGKFAGASRQDTNVVGDIGVTANFAINTYAVRYTAGAGGSISGTASQTVNYGAAATTVTATPATGYHFVSWSDGKFAGASRQDTNVVGDIGVTANFAINTYAVRYTAGAGGSISGTASQTVNYGAAATTVTATPATGYHFVSWSDVKFAGASRQDTNVVGDISATANFAINTYTLAPTAGAHGAIAPAGTITVDYGGAQTFGITADPHYHIDTVLVDGVSAGASSSVTFSAVQSNHSVVASFAIDTFTLTPSAGPHGAISPSAAQTAEYGSSRTFTVTPDTGYHIDDVTIDGDSVGASSSVRFSAVDANHSVAASFAIDTFKLNYGSGTGGSISGAASQTVGYGSSGTTVTAVPATGYHFVQWSDGKKNAVRQDTDVKADLNVSADFEVTYALRYAAESGGTISGDVSQAVAYRADGTTVTAVPDDGHHFVGWSDGLATSAERRDTNVTTEVSATARFAVDTFTITPTAGPNGAISPSTAQPFDWNSTASFTLTPQTGYKIATVLKDNISAPAVSPVVFANVKASHTVSVTFAPGGVSMPSVSSAVTTWKWYDASGTYDGWHGSGASVALQLSRNASTVVKTVSTTVASNSSAYKASVQFPQSGTWYIRATSTGMNPSSWRKVTAGNAVSISAPSVKTTMTHNKAYTVSGTISPRHTSATYLKLFGYRYSGTKVVQTVSFTVKITNTGMPSWSTKYTASVKLPKKGTWKLRAEHLKHGTNPEEGTTWSAFSAKITAK